MLTEHRSGVIVPRLTPEQAVEELSDIALWLLAGAEVEGNYEYNKTLVHVKFSERERVLRREDYELAHRVADEVFNEHVKQKNLIAYLQTVPFLTECRSWLRKKLLSYYYDPNRDKVKVIFLPGDNTGCGYWRMRLPVSRLEDHDNLFVQLSEVPMKYDELLYYDVIVVQRYYEFNQFYTLKMLKKAGKKIVYEIDDDLFSVEPSNPTYNIYNRYDVRTGARFILQLADHVIVTTKTLGEALGTLDKAVIYPNSLDLNEFAQSKKREKDQRPRVFWSGSATHDEDFQQCTPALIRLLKDVKDAELLIIGGLPRSLETELKRYSELRDRVKVTSFMHVEAYFNALKSGVRATTGIVPLKDSKFNHSKSTCKGLEYTAAGLPVIASACPPYSDVYTHNQTALLCTNENDWYKNLQRVLTKPNLGEQLVKNARRLAKRKFDLRDNSHRLGDQLVKLVRDTTSSREQALL